MTRSAHRAFAVEPLIFPNPGIFHRARNSGKEHLSSASIPFSTVKFNDTEHFFSQNIIFLIFSNSEQRSSSSAKRKQLSSRQGMELSAVRKRRGNFLTLHEQKSSPIRGVCVSGESLPRPTGLSVYIPGDGRKSAFNLTKRLV